MIYYYYAVISTTDVTTVDVTIYTYKLPAYYVFIYIRRSSSILNVPTHLPLLFHY